MFEDSDIPYNNFDIAFVKEDVSIVVPLKLNFAPSGKDNSTYLPNCHSFSFHQENRRIEATIKYGSVYVENRFNGKISKLQPSKTHVKHFDQIYSLKSCLLT